MKNVAALLVLGLLSACASQPSAAPVTTTASTVPVTPRIRQERATATLQRIATGDFAGSREWFDAAMTAQISADGVRDAWTSLESQLGPFKSEAFTGATRLQGAIGLQYDLTFQRGMGVAQVVFDDDGRVAGLWLKPVR